MPDVALKSIRTPGGGAALQFKDEGSNLGAASDVTGVNFTGAGVAATLESGTIVVNIPGVAAHEAAVDPHPQYTTAAEVASATDAAVSNHTGAGDPHPQYTTDSDVSTAVSSGIAAHEGAADPHEQYLTEARAATWLSEQMLAASIQFQDEGDNLGTAGTVEELDFVGDGVDVTRVGNHVTVAITGGSANNMSGVYVADEVLGGHRVVRSTGAGEVGYASSDNPAHGDDTVGITTGSVGAGESVQVQHAGYITFIGWSWTAGQPIFLGVTGLLTQTAPSIGFVQVVGHAADATTMFISIEFPIYY